MSPTDNPFRKATDTTERLDATLGVGATSSVYDDTNRLLASRRAITEYRKMGNDSTVAAIMYALTMLVRSVEWSITPGDDAQARRNADYLKEQIDALPHPFSDIPQEAVAGVLYGFSFHEITYTTDSGLIGWSSIDHRPQHTLLKWELDEQNQPEVFVQMLPQGGRADIPVPVKGFLFRTDTTAPSGVSLFRGAYDAWVKKHQAEHSLMVGVDRNLRGMPKILMPSDILAQGEGNAVYDAMKDLVTRIKRDEQMGLLLPSDRDEDGNLLYEFVIETTDAGNYDGIVSVIRMYAQDIATTLLATFLGLGRDATGSRALAEPQQELFRIAVNALLDMVQDQIDRQLIGSLFDLNPTLTGDRPTLTHTPITDVDLEALGGFIEKIFKGGGDWFDDDGETMDTMRRLAGLDADTTR